uniref:C2 domain-containing protein n=1 Tax=Meloidogyne incognita TaxID=6306 RepID=A0A914NJ09_MELIC
LKTHSWIKQEQKRLCLRNYILQERETIIAQFSQTTNDLPAWVQFPDIERIEWVNRILQQLWPYIGEYSNIFLKEFIEPQIRLQMPSPFKSFKFVSIDMGDIPFRVSGLKVYTNNVGRDKVIMDMDLVYAGDAEFTVQACGFRGGLKQIVLSGKLRCTLQPLLPHPPMVGGISGSFIELPKFDFILTGIGEFVQLPGLIDAIRSIINLQLANLAVLPNKIVFPLAPNINVSQLYFPEPDGIVRLKIIQARNLENKDKSFFNKKNLSDPYCEIQLGSQHFLTKVINDNLNPIFNECFEAVVDQASGQRLRIELFDKDLAGADEELGRLSLPLDSVRQAGEIEKWYQLEGCKNGELNLKVCWLDLSTNAVDKQRDEWESEWLGADKPMHPALLMIFLDSVSDLPYPKSGLEPSPLIEFSLGLNKQQSPVKTRTTNPLYQCKFNFFVKQPEGQELKIRAIDDGTKREIGELSIPVRVVMKEPNMELTQQTFYLQHGVHSSPIVLTVRLRFFTPPKNILERKEVAYGTDVHIERGNGSFLSDKTLIDKQQQLIKNKENNNNNHQLNNNQKSDTELDFTPENSTNFTIDGHLRPESAASERSRTSSYSYKKSKTGNFLGKMIGQKHSKIKNRRESSIGLSKINLKLNYDNEQFKLVVNIVEATGLLPISKDGHADPYITLRLIPIEGQRGLASAGSISPGKGGRKQTKIVENCLNPIFNEIFEFGFHFSELAYFKLILTVKDARNYGIFEKRSVLGTAEIPLKDIDPSNPKTNLWLDLIN